MEAMGLSEEIMEEEVSLSCAAPEEALGSKRNSKRSLAHFLTHQHMSKQNGHFKALCSVEVCYEAIDN